MAHEKWLWPVVIIVSACGAAAAAAGMVPASLRLPIVFWFTLVCPGMTLVRFLRLPDRLSELTLAVGTSIALAMTMALIMVYTRLWHPPVGVWLLSAASVTGAGLQLLADSALWRRLATRGAR